MEVKQFTTMRLSHLKIDDLFSLNKSTIEYADRVKGDIGEMPNAILAHLIANNQAMEMQMNKPLKNALTPQLVEMKADRADRFSEIKRNVTTALKGRDAIKKADAKNLKIFLGPYWDTNLKALNTRTGIFSEMMGKYNESEMLKAIAVSIGISQMMVGLETSNTQFNTLYQARLMKEAAVGGPSATSLRADVTYTYNQFCLAVEQAVNFTPTDIFTTLFNQLDELRKTYARLIHTKEEQPETSPAQAE